MFYFGGAGHPAYYIGSADWMTRNLDRRVEAMVRIDEPALQEELDNLLNRYLEDNIMSRVLQPDGRYIRLSPEPGQPERAVQAELMAWYKQEERLIDDPAGYGDQVRLMR